ncbi:hypothetical protein, partial [Sphingomonas sp. GC_Shp_2]
DFKLKNYTDNQWNKIIYVARVCDEAAYSMARRLAMVWLIKGKRAKGELINKVKRELNRVNSLREDIGWPPIGYIGELLQEAQRELISV